jgi:hypothetical protein
LRGTGFVLGAMGGLALALLVVGAASVFPQSGNPFVNTTAQTLVATAASSSSSAIGPEVGAANVARAPQSAGAAPPASSKAAAGPLTVNAKGARPDSLLAVLPGESASGVLETVSPLILGVLVALLIYGVYSRRQDASPGSAA